MCEAWPSSINNTGLEGGTLSKEFKPLKIQLLCNPPIITAVETCTKSPILDSFIHSLSRVDHKRQKSKSRCRDAAQYSVVLPVSADVIDQILFRPTLVITFPGLCTIEIPTSSILNICIGLVNMLLSWSHTKSMHDSSFS